MIIIIIGCSWEKVLTNANDLWTIEEKIVVISVEKAIRIQTTTQKAKNSV